MKKDNRHYTFLITHSSRSSVFIRRIRISKSLTHRCATAVFGLFGIGLISLAGLLNAGDYTSPHVLARATDARTLEDPQIATSSFPLSVSETAQLDESEFLYETEPIDRYENPDISSEFTDNSGGPVSNIRLTNVNSTLEVEQIENQLRVIENSGSAEFIPAIWAHLGKINNEFGFRRNPFGGRSFEFHPGIDIGGEKGDVVVAPANGLVVKAGWMGGYGNLVEVDHGNGLKTRYGHLSRIDVAVGDVIERGQLIALIGSTGRSTGPHLHFELRFNDKPINPRRFLPPEPSELPYVNPNGG